MARKRPFATIELLPSGRWRVKYTGPDRIRRSAPHTFDNRLTAEAWVVAIRRKIDKDQWDATDDDPREADHLWGLRARWLENRQVAGRPIKARTREHYEQILDDHLLDTFGHRQLAGDQAEGRARLVRRDAGRPPHHAVTRLLAAAHHHGVGGQR